MCFDIKCMLCLVIVLIELSTCEKIEMLTNVKTREFVRNKSVTAQNVTTIDTKPVDTFKAGRSFKPERKNSTIQANRRFFGSSNNSPSFPTGYYSLTPPPNYGAEDDSPTILVKNTFKNEYSRKPQMEPDFDISGAISSITDQIDSSENGYKNVAPSYKPYGEKITKYKYNTYTPNRYHRKVPTYAPENSPKFYNNQSPGGYSKTTRNKSQRPVPVTEAPGKFEEIYNVGNIEQLPLEEAPPNRYSVNSYGVPYTAKSASNIKIEPAPPAASVQPDPEHNMKAVKVEMYKSEGQAFILNDDGTLSEEEPHRHS